MFICIMLPLILLGFSKQVISQNLGIGTDTPAGKVHIKGTADVSQLIINGYSNQTNTHPFIKFREPIFGNDLMWINTDHELNVFIGYNAGKLNDSDVYGRYNTFIGSHAGESNTTGWFNTAHGAFALYTNDTGNYNTACGESSLKSNNSGVNNTACGYSALNYNTTGSPIYHVQCFH